MKKLLLLSLLVPMISFGQNNVNVKNSTKIEGPKTNGQIMVENEGMSYLGEGIYRMQQTVSSEYADCVYDAKECQSYQLINNNTFVLKDCYSSNDILIKTYCYIYESSEITILKDEFCSYDSNVIVIDGEVCDVNEVEFL